MKKILVALLGLFLCASLARADILFPNAPTTGQIYNFNNTGVLYQWDGAKWVTTGTTSPALTKQVFTASGTYTPSSGMQYAIIECVGGGGGGGGATGTAGGGFGGGGGGAGAYSRAYVTAAQVGASQSVTIGGAGAASSAGGDGGTGGDTSVGSLCVAKGGSGGLHSSNAIGGVGGIGGSGASGTGDVKGYGANGDSGVYSGTTTMAGSSGNGASSPFGGGAVGQYSGSACANGQNATGYGSGGGGSWCIATTNSGSGGTGTAGIVIVTEFLSSQWGGPLPQVVNPQGRLTLTTATPVTTSDVTAATTVYYTPYKGTYAPLYNGTQFTPVYFSELSLVLGANWATNSNYDVFLVNNAGVLDICTGPAWTSDTARGTGAGTTELEQKQGIYANKNSLTCRTDNATTITVAVDQGTYLGTFRTVAAGQTEDSAAKRFVWNMYNRVNRALKVVDATATWTYSTAAMRQANGNTANQAAIVRGLDEEAVTLSLTAEASTSAATARETFNSIGLDSTTVDVPGCMTDRWVTSSTGPAGGSCTYSGLPGLGYHFLAWLEYAGGADVQTWYGTSGNLKSGMLGSTPQ